MKIKALQVFGFKSFGDRTELNFDRQIVGVVGPNGCGKSNIVDAIRWAMGEQSAKGLRGSEMADVIFNGTATRKRANFAEVSIVFENNQGLAPAPYNDCTEIMITRRLYRSGESEYLINKVAARLKDINDLFLGTGSSARAYSIVAQGKIDQIVLAKPEDRRFLLEEAAGIAKYKVRKQSAERKMEATRTNLERINDILQELERSSRSLERQVEKAEQFRKLQTELRHLDEQIISAKIARLDKRTAQNNDLRANAQAIFEENAQNLSRLEAEIETLRLEALNQEKISASDYEALISAKERLANADKESELRIQRISNLKNQIVERERDIERLRSKRDVSQDAMSRLLSEREELEGQKTVQETEVASLKSSLDGVLTQISELESKVQTERQKLEALKEVQIREQSRRDHLRSELVELEMKRAELERLLEDLAQRLSTLTSQDFSLAVDLEELEAERMHREGDLKRLEEAERDLMREHGDVVRAKSDLQETQANVEAELSSLSALEQHEVGYRSGPLSHKKKSGAPFIMDLVSFKPEYSKVAEAFFEEFGQDFVESADFDLADERWSFIRAHAGHRFERSLMGTVESTQSDGLKAILESIELVDVLPSQASQSIQIDLQGRMRIPFGNSLSKESAGQTATKESPFNRKAQREDLERQRMGLETDLAAKVQLQQEVEAKLKNASGEIERVRLQIRDLLSKIQVVQGQRAQTSAQRESIEKRQEEFRGNSQEIDQRVERCRKSLEELSTEASFGDLEAVVNSLTGELHQARIQKAQLDGVWIEKRIAFGALLERLERLEQQTIQQEMTNSEYRHNEGLYESDIKNWKEDIVREDEAVVRLSEEKTVATGLIATLESGLADNKSILNRLRSQVDQYESERKDVQIKKDESQKTLQELELEHQRLKFEVEEISQIVQERYHISLAEILEQVDASAIERLEDDTVLGSLEVDAQEIRAKLEKFGDVNLLALTEYEQIKKRLDFMNTQKEDLLKTLDALQSIILRINKITEFRFRETFTAINHNFQILFPKLFGGGKAYMTLTDEKNLLETGIEIFAEPPGKKVQTMSLLSGGEKAMTSISLLFALFAYRPASFCILDEVDAPLDEVNTVRYNQIIEEMSVLSQFIVITHNKRTMEVAHKLYGVTMQDPGVSQLVGVELQQARALAS